MLSELCSAPSELGISVRRAQIDRKMNFLARDNALLLATEKRWSIVMCNYNSGEKIEQHCWPLLLSAPGIKKAGSSAPGAFRNLYG